MNDPYPFSQYSAAAAFSRMFTLALIRVKKDLLGFTEEDACSGEALAARRKELALMLENIVDFLKSPDQDFQKNNWIGEAFIETLEKNVLNMHSLVDELQVLKQKLIEPETVLSAADFRLLDDIARAADQQASRAFQQMTHH